MILLEQLLPHSRIADDEERRLQTEAGHGEHLALVDLGHHHHAVLRYQRLDRTADVFERLVGRDRHAIATEGRVRGCKAETNTCDTYDRAENHFTEPRFAIHFLMSFSCGICESSFA